MNEGNIRSHINDICKASEFFDADGYYPRKVMDVIPAEYSKYSKCRLEVVAQKFEQIGYTGNFQEFSYEGLEGVNGVFTHPNSSLDKILVVAHHDYRGGLGANDNAASLAVMLETARFYMDSEIGQRLVFVSFDFEELSRAGSEHYVSSLSSEYLEQIHYVVGLDCLGGPDIVICKSVSGFESDPRLVKMFYDISEKVGHPFEICDINLESDLTSFAKANGGILGIGVCGLDLDLYRFCGDQSPNSAFGVAHTNKDVPENVNIENVIKIGETLLGFVKESMNPV